MVETTSAFRARLIEPPSQKSSIALRRELTRSSPRNVYKIWVRYVQEVAADVPEPPIGAAPRVS